MARFRRTIWAGDTVPASGSLASPAIDVSRLTGVQPFIEASGANVTVSLQTSIDDGVTWFDLASYAAGATGPQQTITNPGLLIRFSAANSSTAAESISLSLINEG